MRHFFLFIFSILLFSCSNNDTDILNDARDNNSELKSIYTNSADEYYKHIKQSLQLIFDENPKSFEFVNSNSELFIVNENDNRIKSSSQTLYAFGFDKKAVLDKYKLTFGFPYHPRLLQGVPYYTELCQYTKYVEIPKGYSIAIPPPNQPNFMSVKTKSIYNPNMGYIPDNFFGQTGYSIIYISSSGDKDKYAFITNVEIISKNLKNKKVLNPVVYCPEGVTNPETFEFAYQIVNSEW